MCGGGVALPGWAGLISPRAAARAGSGVLGPKQPVLGPVPTAFWAAPGPRAAPGEWWPRCAALPSSVSVFLLLAAPPLPALLISEDIAPNQGRVRGRAPRCRQPPVPWSCCRHCPPPSSPVLPRPSRGAPGLSPAVRWRFGAFWGDLGKIKSSKHSWVFRVFLAATRRAQLSRCPLGVPGAISSLRHPPAVLLNPRGPATSLQKELPQIPQPPPFNPKIQKNQHSSIQHAKPASPAQR